MKLVINGEQEMLEKESVTVAELLKIKGVDAPDMVSVQKNGAFVERAQFDTTPVADGDSVDFLYFMGGGAH
jgi:sulfur carrier protein